MMAIVNIATQLTDSKRIADLKKKISNEVKSERHSLSSVAELKKCTDTVDNFYISSINESNMNGRPSHVFKTSRKMARMAINMDQKYLIRTHHKRNQHTLMACARGALARKLLTLWVYHNASRKLLRLATMEVKGETSENVVLFWRLFNEVLAEVKGEPGYQFNPCGWITDEAGANFNGIGMVYGQQALQKSYSCRFHYTQCLNNLL